VSSGAGYVYGTLSEELQGTARCECRDRRWIDLHVENW